MQETRTREFRVEDGRSTIDVFIGKSKRPVFTLYYNPADMFIAGYIENICKGFEEIDNDMKRGMIEELEYAANLGNVLAENFDAICGEGTARLIGRYDTSGEYELFFDIMDEIQKGIEAHLTAMAEKAKKDQVQAVIDSRKEGSSYIAPQ